MTGPRRTSERTSLASERTGTGPARRPRVTVVGDVVLDVDVVGEATRLCPDAPVPVLDATDRRSSPGAAGLTALLCAASGADVTLVAPLADDDAGRTLRALLEGAVRVVALGHDGPTRTKTRLRAGGQSLLRLDEGGPAAPTGRVPAEAAETVRDADVVLVSDYGAGTAAEPALRDLLARRAATGRRRLVVWDPHPRGPLPVPGCTVVTPNLAEGRGALGDGHAASAPDEVAAALREHWRATAVCVTTGASGAVVSLSGSEPLRVPVPAAASGDPCGAGDRFAATVAVGLASGAVVTDAVVAAVRDASAWVAAGGAAGFRDVDGVHDVDDAGPGGPAVPGRAPSRDVEAPGGESPGGESPGDEVPGDEVPGAEVPGAAHEDVDAVVARLRRPGRTLVATGGCFDVLHAGHVACLQAARGLGDALVVLLNSDASVRRAKGPDRPAVPQADRARVLRGLACVDAVVVFDEDEPTAVLDRLRPDVWVKGGDYGGTELPEAETVRRHGGRVALLPYLRGRSSTRILARAASTPSPSPTSGPPPAPARPHAPDHRTGGTP
ncbi:PfkB family carbohydrate kinase [Thalassiella azotivora]